MLATAIKIRGREFSTGEIDMIKNIVHQNTDQSRRHISRLICMQLRWVQPNGWFKDRACRDVLLKLEAKNLIALPPVPKITSKRLTKSTSTNNKHETHTPDSVEGEMQNDNAHRLKILMVRHTPYEKEWNSLVAKHHYLGYKLIVGRHLKYTVYLNDEPVACLGWGDAAWAVACRDKRLGWSTEERKNNISTIINNTRFLILPWVKMNNLASKILSMNARQVSADWLKFYNESPSLAETFVEKERFLGTCYKAANWIHVGTTQGTSKKGSSHVKHNNKKDVYLYPLNRSARKLMNDRI